MVGRAGFLCKLVKGDKPLFDGGGRPSVQVGVHIVRWSLP